MRDILRKANCSRGADGGACACLREVRLRRLPLLLFERVVRGRADITCGVTLRQQRASEGVIDDMRKQLFLVKSALLVGEQRLDLSPSRRPESLLDGEAALTLVPV